jgi:hypothetical protein
MGSMKGTGIAASTATWIALVMIQTSAVAAQPVRYDLDSADPLIADGFMLDELEPSQSFTGGQLHITTTKGFSEWILQATADGNRRAHRVVCFGKFFARVRGGGVCG